MLCMLCIDCIGDIILAFGDVGTVEGFETMLVFMLALIPATTAAAFFFRCWVPGVFGFSTLLARGFFGVTGAEGAA